MTLQDLAEQLRTVAYGLDESNRRWDANDQHVIRLNRTIAELQTRLAVAQELYSAAQAKLDSQRPKHRAPKKKKKKIVRIVRRRNPRA